MMSLPCQLAREVCAKNICLGSPVRGSVMVSRGWVLHSGASWDTGTSGSRDNVGSSTSGVTMADMSGILKYCQLLFTK